MAIIKKLRGLMRGTAWWDEGAGHMRQMSGEEVLRHWRILPTRAAIAVKQVAWLKSMVEHEHEHRQTISAVWGHMMRLNEVTTIDEGVGSGKVVTPMREGLRSHC